MTPLLTTEKLSLRFAPPWPLEDYATFLRAKALPEARIDFDDEADTYTVSAPARFAHLLGLEAPRRDQGGFFPAAWLLDYQAWIVKIAVEAKRFAIWSDCGTGKTPMQLEWARAVRLITQGHVLILAPPRVVNQTLEEARKFYPNCLDMWPVKLESREEIAAFCNGTLTKPGADKLGICNYEKFIPGVIPELNALAGLVADESSLLKSGGGVIKWNLINSARGIEYKLSCTATPAPNDTMEYASQASFLEKLRSEGEILWTWFTRDPKTQVWKVKPHAREAFYQFMSSWSIYLRKPAAYGFKDPFADVPEPLIMEHKVGATAAQIEAAAKYGGAIRPGELIPAEKLGVTARTKLSQIAKGFIYDETAKYPAAPEMDGVRQIDSLKPGKVVELVQEELRAGRQVLVWCVFDFEAQLLGKLLQHEPGMAQLHGGTPEAEQAAILEDFRHGKVRVLVSKARLLGWGMNFQFCEAMVFSGFDDSFEAFYQAVRRCYRYGSKNQLRVHVPYVPGLEDHVWENVLRKKGQWEADTAECERAYAGAFMSGERRAE